MHFRQCHLLEQFYDKYLEILKTTWLVDNIIPDSNKEENIKSFLYKIFVLD
jgi:hypothetical protein